MKNYMDYSTPHTIKESGARAYRLGVEKSDCPISRRTGANGIHWWHDGWDEEAAKICKGINCAARRGVGHSKECIAEHEEAACPEIFKGTREALNRLRI